MRIAVEAFAIGTPRLSDRWLFNLTQPGRARCRPDPAHLKERFSPLFRVP